MQGDAQVGAAQQQGVVAGLQPQRPAEGARQHSMGGSGQLQQTAAWPGMQTGQQQRLCLSLLVSPEGHPPQVQLPHASLVLAPLRAPPRDQHQQAGVAAGVARAAGATVVELRRVGGHVGG